MSDSAEFKKQKIRNLTYFKIYFIYTDQPGIDICCDFFIFIYLNYGKIDSALHLHKFHYFKILNVGVV